MNTGKHTAMVLIQSLLGAFVFVCTLLIVVSAIMYIAS